MESNDREADAHPWHLLLAVGWGFLTAVAFIGDAYRYSEGGRPIHPNDEEYVATIRVADGSAPSSSTTGTEREKRRQELRNESFLSYGNSFPERGPLGLLYIHPCGLFFCASCILTFCGSKGRVAGAALGLSVLWVWAFQHSTFWHPRWM